MLLHRQYLLLVSYSIFSLNLLPNSHRLLL
jgi:hypothetical protein